MEYHFNFCLFRPFLFSDQHSLLSWVFFSDSALILSSSATRPTSLLLVLLEIWSPSPAAPRPWLKHLRHLRRPELLRTTAPQPIRPQRAEVLGNVRKFCSFEWGYRHHLFYLPWCQTKKHLSRYFLTAASIWKPRPSNWIEGSSEPWLLNWGAQLLSPKYKLY